MTSHNAASLPTNDAHNAMDQASATAGLYFFDAIKAIDSKFGEGYAKKHPELIAGFMQTAASDYNAWSLGVNTAHLCNSLESIVNEIYDVKNELGNIKRNGIDQGLND